MEPRTLKDASITLGQRQLTIERLLYRAPYCNIIMMGRFRGTISEEAARKALAKARLKYPLTRARVRQESDGSTAFVLDSPMDIELVAKDKETDGDWLEWAWNDQQRPFHLSQGPLIRFLLLRSADTSDLIVVCHHSICDGLSLTYLLKDVARFLRDAEAQEEPLPMPPVISEENFPFQVRVGRFFRFTIRRLNRSWQRDKVVFGENQYEELYTSYWRSSNVGHSVITLSENTTSALVSRCHAERVTVNSALTAAFALAQYDLQGTGQGYLKKALVAFNMRDFFTHSPGENFGLLAAGVQVNLPHPGSDLWEAARIFNAQIARLRSDPRKILEFMAPLSYLDPTLIDAVYFVAHGTFSNRAALRLKRRILTPTDEPKRSLDVTNVGVVKLDPDTALQTLFFVPILSPVYEKAIGIATAGGMLNMVILHNRSRTDSEAIGEFQRRCVDYIRKAIAQNPEPRIGFDSRAVGRAGSGLGLWSEVVLPSLDTVERAPSPLTSLARRGSTILAESPDPA